MRGGVRSIQVFLFAILIGCVACWGGSGSGTQPPPPQPDFAIAVSPSSVDVSQGSTSSPVSVSITGQNGFSASVQVLLTGLPAGVSTNPASPLTVAAGQSISVLFGASSDAAPGQSNVTAQGSSGSLSHSQALSLSVQAAAQTNLPRSTFVATDSVTSLDSPPGEARRRHMVFDAVNQRVYVANSGMNRVDVLAAGNPAPETTIDVPGASSVDLSADGATLWIATTPQQILAVDTSTLHVKGGYPVAGLTPIPNIVFDRPTEALALSSGKLLVRLRQSAASQALLALWDPSSNTFTDLTSLAPAVFQNGVGVIARAGNHNSVLATANDSTGALAVFDSNGNLLAGPHAPLAGTISVAAANSGGTLFAIALNASGVSQVLLLDGRLNVLGNYATPGTVGLVFSVDSQYLYVAEPYGNASVISVLSANNLQKLGEIPDIVIQGVPTRIEEVAASPFLCGLGNRGISFLDVSQRGSLSSAAPVFSSTPVVQPSEGPAVGGTAVSLLGSNFSSNPQLRFGVMNPVNGTAASTFAMHTMGAFDCASTCRSLSPC
jgi:hypothetical protein